MAAVLWPALVNRFPLVMGDSFRYLLEAQGDYSWVSSQFYGYFLGLFSGTSLWVVAVVQAVVAAAVVATFLRRVAGLSHPAAAMVIIVLAATSPLALFAGLIMTDLWFGLGLVAAVVLLVGERSLPSDLAMTAVVAFTAAAHPAALPLLGLLVMAAGVVAVWRRTRAGTWGDAGGSGLLALGVGIAVLSLMVNNQVVWGKLSPNPHSSVVAFAYLLGHGDLEDELAGCTQWEMCTVSQRPPAGINGFNRFLFNEGGVLYTELGGPVAYAPEATEIVLTHVTNDPIAYAKRVYATGVDQLFLVGAFNHVSAVMERMNVNRISQIAAFSQADGPRFAASRTFRRTLDLGPYTGVGMVFAWLGVAATAGALVGRLVRRHSRRATAWPATHRRPVGGATVLAALYVVHAFVVGTTAYSAARYGGRMLWLLVLAWWALASGWARAARDARQGSGAGETRPSSCGADPDVTVELGNEPAKL
ncbi:MAG: hypothetical protein H0V96_05010 [Acidimicrobiia bacterium]|nr:hypothetical protein [Acidimicrobiia bacterium]